jgi:hypothetical protein
MHSAQERRLSASSVLVGLRCPKLLWWNVHEPEAPELMRSAADEESFRRWREIADLARSRAPGALVEGSRDQLGGRLEATRRWILRGKRRLYGASFAMDGLSVTVDLLERRHSGLVLVDIRSPLSVKEEHVAKAAVKLHVLKASGVRVKRVEIMHLRRECEHPDLSNLFVREDVTRRVRAARRSIRKKIHPLLRVLDGPLPATATGAQCMKPEPCPFFARCWPPAREHHVRTLYRVSAKTVRRLLRRGHETISDLPEDFAAKGPARRQIESIRTGKLIVERGLKRELAKIRAPIAFLDFETISPAVPAWPGCRPYENVPAEWSCHVRNKNDLIHHEWLGEGTDDPRPTLARALLSACADAKSVLVYNASFEERCIRGLERSVPSLASDLRDLRRRIRDLLPIIRDHVYHPSFFGSFSLKRVLPALLPELGYGDLEIQHGQGASVALERLLLRGDELGAKARARTRDELLRYCERDTLALVRLYEKLLELARAR